MNDSFPFLWPIKVARVVVSLFVSMFYIASLNIFLMASACDKQGGHWKHIVFDVGKLHGAEGLKAVSQCHHCCSVHTQDKWHLACCRCIAVKPGAAGSDVALGLSLDADANLQRCCTLQLGMCAVRLCCTACRKENNCIIDRLPIITATKFVFADCLALPHVIHAAFSIASGVVFLTVALLLVGNLQPMHQLAAAA
eukprot:GHRR01033887.1.p1 GENE.GHRR01033887.1~~GHRR01033887.1.p1  ORF type:complete len:216 (-),score=55.63 GHRR01033887.1:411-998(-)